MKRLLLNRNFFMIVAAIAAVLFSGCDNKSEPARQQITPVSKQVFSGKVQKGPLLSGSSVSIYELDGEFNQTGKAFATTIANDDGAFEQRNMNLTSQFVEIRAEGYYFNEVSGKESQSTIALSAVADISTANSVNVNVLTTLERQRILYLIQNEGKSFENAKNQAHNEVLAVFSMSDAGSDAVELNLDNDAQLLAASAILLGTRTDAEISRLLASIANDLRTDGVLDNAANGSEMINGADMLDAEAIKANMDAHGMAVGYSAEVLQQYLDAFVEGSQYQPSERIVYPATSDYGANVLAPDATSFHANTDYSFAVVTPKWAALKIEVTGKPEWQFYLSPYPPVNWSYNTMSSIFVDGEYYHTQTFSVTKPGEESLLRFKSSGGVLTLKFYENNATEPTFERQITFESPSPVYE